MVVFLKLVGIAAVGAAAWILMRPRTPFLPPSPLGKKRRVSVTGPEEEDLQEDLPPLRVNRPCFILLLEYTTVHLKSQACKSPHLHCLSHCW